MKNFFLPKFSLPTRLIYLLKRFVVNQFFIKIVIKKKKRRDNVFY